jgi:hypothetical protein
MWPDYRSTDGDIYMSRIADTPTATRIADFRVSLDAGSVRIEWVRGVECACVSFRLLRSREGAAWESLEMFDAGDRQQFACLDSDVEAGSRYQYRLDLVGADDATTIGGLASIEVLGEVGRLAWAQAWPNPSVAPVRIALRCPVRAGGIVEVFDVTGQRVRTLHRGVLPAGEVPIEWAGTDDRGRRVPAGVYLLRASQRGERAVVRIVRMN